MKSLEQQSQVKPKALAKAAQKKEFATGRVREMPVEDHNVAAT
jgi:hypothetical protein